MSRLPGEAGTELEGFLRKMEKAIVCFVRYYHIRLHAFSCFNQSLKRETLLLHLPKSKVMFEGV